MNTYYKFAPNVFLAKCDEKHEKGETIEVTTKYGKENESIVFNLIFEKDGFYYYSIVRADGFNAQEWAKRRAERRRKWAASALKTPPWASTSFRTRTATGWRSYRHAEKGCPNRLTLFGHLILRKGEKTCGGRL